MLCPRTASRPVRAAFAALAAALIALRLLSPAGFMPAFNNGVVTIVACPDFVPPVAAMKHHGDHRQAAHPLCPYAAAASLDGLDLSAPLLAALMLFGVDFLPGRAFAFVQRHAPRERPPSRGPPIPA